jgi:hypothetical protein
MTTSPVAQVKVQSRQGDRLWAAVGDETISTTACKARSEHPSSEFNVGTQVAVSRVFDPFVLQLLPGR